MIVYICNIIICTIEKYIVPLCKYLDPTMKNLLISIPKGKRLVWYLAAEEYFAKNLQSLQQTVNNPIPSLQQIVNNPIQLLNQTLTKPKQMPAHQSAECLDKNNGIFFTWIVPPTVIFGRHQVMENEVNIPFCQEHMIAMFRRKSGGGCVYADEGNLMISYISPSSHSEQVFQTYLDKMSNTLSQMGYDAVKSSHNDIMIGDYKVSGNACFALPNATIVHGTLLYNVNFDILQQAITPSSEKLAKHGVESVRQRVMNLKDIANTNKLSSTQALAQKIEEIWCQKIYLPTEEDLQEIDKIEQEYLNPAFILSR